MNTIKHKVIQRVNECITHANQHIFKPCPIPLNQTGTQGYFVPSLRFDIRGKTAGMALPLRWELRFNPVLLQENPDAFLQEVVPHEISHLLVYAQFGRVRPHGKQWQDIMQHVFDVKPKTTHSFDVSSVQGKTFPYQCGCNVIHLSLRRHNKVQTRKVNYFCRRCKKKLFLCP